MTHPQGGGVGDAAPYMYITPFLALKNVTYNYFYRTPAHDQRQGNRVTYIFADPGGSCALTTTGRRCRFACQVEETLPSSVKPLVLFAAAGMTFLGQNGWVFVGTLRDHLT